jgi:DNA replication and repair protein RecF
VFLEKLALFNFKNHEEASFAFCRDVNCFTGNNGSGKTNVLDAIYYLGLCKSFFSVSDSQCIRQGASFFTIHGTFTLRSSVEDIYCGLKAGQRKIMKRNQKEYQRLADHLGLIPVVMIAPSDQELVTSGSEERRKLMDNIICQCDKLYVDQLTSYIRILQQRNALLKNMAKENRSADGALAVWDEQLAAYGTVIHKKRQQFTAAINDDFNRLYRSITGDKETASFSYNSALNTQDMLSLLQVHHHRDSMLQYTSSGIHKDDLEFLISDKSVRKFGSQGQQKSFIVAFKLALYQYIKRVHGENPILLLDDIFEKLDDNRMHNLLSLVGGDDFGQLFITDTHEGRAERVFKKYGKEVKSYHFE